MTRIGFDNFNFRGQEIIFKNKYRIVFSLDEKCFLGSGTYGLVFRGWDVSDASEKYAVKLVFSLSGLDPTTLKEISILKKLPPWVNVVGCYDIFFHDMSGFLRKKSIMPRAAVFIMEKCENFTNLLRDMSKIGVLLPRIQRSICFQLMNGLNFLHSHHILHRDLKPGNILYTEHVGPDDPHYLVKIIDFGLARDLTSPIYELNSGAISLGYRPPEMYCGFTNYTSAVDVFSLGCIFYHIFTGSLLFSRFYTESCFATLDDFNHFRLLCIFRIFGIVYPHQLQYPAPGYRYPVFGDPKHESHYSPYRPYRSSNRYNTWRLSPSVSVSAPAPASAAAHAPAPAPAPAPREYTFTLWDTGPAIERPPHTWRPQLLCRPPLPSASQTAGPGASEVDAVLRLRKLPLDDYDIVRNLGQYPDAFELIESMLQINPVCRPTMEQAIKRAGDLNWMVSTHS